MRLFKPFAAALTVTGALAAAGAVQAGELRVVNGTSLALMVTVDSTGSAPLPPSSLSQRTLAAGSHEVLIVAPDGSAFRQTMTFTDAEAAEVGGRKHWCLIVMSPAPGAELKAVRPETAWCKGFVEKAS